MVITKISIGVLNTISYHVNKSTVFSCFQNAIFHEKIAARLNEIETTQARENRIGKKYGANISKLCPCFLRKALTLQSFS